MPLGNPYGAYLGGNPTYLTIPSLRCPAGPGVSAHIASSSQSFSAPHTPQASRSLLLGKDPFAIPRHAAISGSAATRDLIPATRNKRRAGLIKYNPVSVDETARKMGIPVEQLVRVAADRDLGSTRSARKASAAAEERRLPISSKQRAFLLPRSLLRGGLTRGCNRNHKPSWPTKASCRSRRAHGQPPERHQVASCVLRSP
jgi:hypothetical protein